MVNLWVNKDELEPKMNVENTADKKEKPEHKDPEKKEPKNHLVELELIKEQDGSFKKRLDSRLSPNLLVSVEPLSSAYVDEWAIEVSNPEKETVEQIIEKMRQGINTKDIDPAELEKIREEADREVNEVDGKLAGFKEVKNFLNQLCGANDITGEGQTIRMGVIKKESAAELLRREPGATKTNELNEIMDNRRDVPISRFFVIPEANLAGLANIYHNNNINGEFVQKQWGALVSFNGVSMMFIYPETTTVDE